MLERWPITEFIEQFELDVRHDTRIVEREIASMAVTIALKMISTGKSYYLFYSFHMLICHQLKAGPTRESTGAVYKGKNLSR